MISSDIFYHQDDCNGKWAKMGCLAVEMETYALFTTAASLKKEAMALFTVSDSLVSNEKTSADEREKTFTEMMDVALGLI